MLHEETVERETFELLKRLMHDSRLEQFNLTGGTALALYLGHRKSIDLDLFTPSNFSAKELEEYLIQAYDFKSGYLEKNTLKGTINGIKIDCITHNYPYIEKPFVTNDGIRLYGMRDIVAMKLSAIADNGTRLKDFIDIACLSTKFSLDEMLGFYEKKYKNCNSIRPLKGLSYYDDIIFNDPIEMINGKYSWKLVEKRIENMINRNKAIFHDFPIEYEKKSREHKKGYKL